MKSHKNLLFSCMVLLLTGCASGYKTINPDTLNYSSRADDKSVTLEYKYGVLTSRYARKETNNGMRLVAVKITNNSGRDLTFGKDIKLTYTNDSELPIQDDEVVYQTLKQGWAGYLLYLLLTPAKLTTSSNGAQTSSTPIGYAIGPGLAAGNIIAAGAANDNFKAELLKYNISGSLIKNGSTVYGLIGIKSDNFDAIKVMVSAGSVAQGQ
ncbi:MAG: hypothetical protein JSU01_12465 [Bacteroidetes bacterium]|nr:hypothetical protein [Bacteroidota bacterium]